MTSATMRKLRGRIERKGMNESPNFLGFLRLTVKKMRAMRVLKVMKARNLSIQSTLRNLATRCQVRMIKFTLKLRRTPVNCHQK